MRKKGIVNAVNRTNRRGIALGLLVAAVLVGGTGCSPKTYISTYSADGFDPQYIKNVTLVVDDIRVDKQHSLLFAETFLKTALEMKKLPLARNHYVLKENLPKSEAVPGGTAYLEIALTHCYPGAQSQNFPTSVGAVARVVEPKTDKMLWNINYAYASPGRGPSAPMIEEVMHSVAEKIIESIPLENAGPKIAAYTPPKSVRKEVSAPVPNREKITTGSPRTDPKIPIEAPKPRRVFGIDSGKPAEPDLVKRLASVSMGHASSPYLIHVASVRQKHLAERFIDTKTGDGTVRLSNLVTLNPDKPWYRLLIGRFKDPDESRSYVQALMPKDKIGGYAKPLKLPYSLLISSKRPLESSQKIVGALRKIDYMAYLSPSGESVNTYNVLVGAYGTENEAKERAELLLSNGIQVKIISP